MILVKAAANGTAFQFPIPKNIDNPLERVKVIAQTV
jgi:hypothetical protein